MLQDQITSVWPEWSLVEPNPEIGHGAYGRVYKIRSNTGFGAEGVIYQALKVISIPLDEDDIDILALGDAEREAKSEYYRSMAEKLAKEATFMSELQGHPNIVGYAGHAIVPRDDGKSGWTILIRMELLTPFKQYVAIHGFSRQDIIKLGIDICRALEFCKKQDVIHRDIKPENIFISETGSYKLGDFGVAVNADKTLGGLSKKGTYAYMAPEVYRGQPYGPTVDIYSLGLILYRLLNKGKEPFVPVDKEGTYEERELALSRRMQCESLPDPANENGKLARVAKKAAEPRPEDRYATPTEMRVALEELVNQNDSEVMIMPMKSGRNIFTDHPSSEKNSSGSTEKRAEREPRDKNPEEKEPEPKESETEVPKKPSTKGGKTKIWITCIAFLAVAVGVFGLMKLGPAPDAESLEIYIKEETVTDGETCKLYTTFYPKRASDDIAWSTSNRIIATIDENGVLTAHTAGTVAIFAETAGGITASCDVTVVSNEVTEYKGIDYAPVYDFNYYIETYSDMKELYSDDPEGALQYFVEYGIPSGEQGISTFNVLGYANLYPDVREHYGNDLTGIVGHYLNYGAAEGRNGVGSGEMHGYVTVYDGIDYSLVYDYNYYVDKYPYVYDMYGVDDTAVLKHFVTTGMENGERGCADFDPISYAYAYPDVRERCRISTDGYTFEYYVALGHFDYTPYYIDYMEYGVNAGYRGIGCFKMKDYTTVYEGVDYSDQYSYVDYCKRNNDVFVICGVDDYAVLEHYVVSGRAEGRIALG